jgi:hypothetical protein
MLEQIKIKNVLFLDIETVPIKENFEDLSAPFQKLWEVKTVWQRKDGVSPSDFYKLKAGVMLKLFSLPITFEKERLNLQNSLLSGQSQYPEIKHFLF